MTKSASDINLNDAFKQLEKIVSEFESGEVDLEASIPKFKQGLELARQLKTRLVQIENQITEIKDQFKDVDAGVVNELPQ